MAQPTGLQQTLQLLQQLQTGAQADVDSAIRAQGGAGSRLQQAMSQPVNRRFSNPGQTVGDVFGGENQTGIQNQALMQMGLGLLEGGYEGGAGIGLSRGVQQGMNTLNALRESQKKGRVENAATGYQLAGDQVKSAKDRRDNLMATQGGIAGNIMNPNIPSALRESMALGMMNEDEKADYLASKRAGQLLDMGGGVMGRMNPITGQIEPVTLPGQTRDAFRKEFSEAESTLGRAKAYSEMEAKGQAGIDVAFQEAMTNEIPEIQGYLEELKQLRTSIASGELQRTGFFEGRFMKFVNGKVAAFNAQAVESAVKALSEAKLQPVSDNEFQTIQSSVANVLNEPEANLALLDRQIQKLEESMQRTAKKARYFRENGGTLKNWQMFEFEERMREMEQGSSEAAQRGGAGAVAPPPSEGEVDLSGLM